MIESDDDDELNDDESSNRSVDEDEDDKFSRHEVSCVNAMSDCLKLITLFDLLKARDHLKGMYFNLYHHCMNLHDRFHP